MHVLIGGHYGRLHMSASVRPFLGAYFTSPFLITFLLLPVSPSLSLRNTIKSIYRRPTATRTLRNVHLAVAQRTRVRCAAVSKNAVFFIEIMRNNGSVLNKLNGEKQDTMIALIQDCCVVADIGHTCNIVHGVRH